MIALSLAAATQSNSSCDRRAPTDTSSTTAQQVLLPYFSSLNQRCKHYEERESASRTLHYSLAFGGLLIGALGGLAGLFLRAESTQRKVAQATSLLTGLVAGFLGIGHFDAATAKYHQCLTATARAQDRIVAEYASFTTINAADTAAVTVFRRQLEADVQNNCTEP